MRCMSCQGKMRKAFVPSTSTAEDTIYRWKRCPPGCVANAVPHFEQREVKTIQRLLLQLDKQTANLASVA